MKISDEIVERARVAYEGSIGVRDAMRSALEATIGGMVLVPREPTPEMLARYEHVRSGADWQPNVFPLSKRRLARHRKAYAAMLAATQSADTGEGREGVR